MKNSKISFFSMLRERERKKERGREREREGERERQRESLFEIDHSLIFCNSLFAFEKEAYVFVLCLCVQEVGLYRLQTL